MARLFTEMTRSFQVCFPKTFSLTENQFSGKTYLYTIHPCSALPALSAPLRPLGISWAAHSCTPQVFSAHLPEAESQKGHPRFGL